MSSRKSLLGPVFGLFVWAIHLVVVYGVAATICQLSARHVIPEWRSSLAVILVVVTLIAVTINAGHAILNFRNQRDVEALHFRLTVTIACDAVATLAILWQLLAVALIPVCI